MSRRPALDAGTQMQVLLLLQNLAPRTATWV